MFKRILVPTGGSAASMAAADARGADAPSEAILEAVRELHGDPIVTGSRGRGPVRALLPGTQTQAGLVQGPVPVMVVSRPDAPSS